MCSTELGVKESFTAMPFFANKPLSCAAQIGQLPPPPNAITSRGLGPCARLAPVTVKSAVAAAIFLSALMVLPLNNFQGERIRLINAACADRGRRANGLRPD